MARKQWRVATGRKLGEMEGQVGRSRGLTFFGGSEGPGEREGDNG